MSSLPIQEDLNHTRLLASLDDETRLTLTQKSNLPALIRLLSHALVLSVTSLWIISGIPSWQIALVLQGILLVFTFTLLHETSHFTAVKNEQLNRFIGWLCALIIILPPNWFRYFHLAHHRHTNDPETDPELEGGKPETLAQYVWAISGIPVWKFHVATLLKNAFGRFEYAYLPQRRHALIRWEARAMLAFYASIAVLAISFGASLVVWLWLIPLVLGQPFLRLYLLAEHGGCPPVANMLENTRTTFTNTFVRWLAWNMPYHAEHHAYPAVPFHQLPAFHAIAKPHLKTTSKGYAAFHRETLDQMQT